MTAGDIIQAIDDIISHYSICVYYSVLWYLFIYFGYHSIRDPHAAWLCPWYLRTMTIGSRVYSDLLLWLVVLFNPILMIFGR